MLIKRIENATRVLGAPIDWDGQDMTCGALPVREVETSEGTFLVSAWEPTPDEIKRIINGASIHLWVRGKGHPVVALSVDKINEEK